jgi:DNA-binding XRE family transcriptional regulator
MTDKISRPLPGRAPNHLKNIREAEGMSQAALAHQANLAARTINRVEKGLPCAPSTKGRIAKVFILMTNGLKTYIYEDIFPSKGGDGNG